MRWKAKPPVDQTKWHEVFAYWPHRASGPYLGDCWVWLERVRRKGRYFPCYDPEDPVLWVWEYEVL
jgi:hypothetical protein